MDIRVFAVESAGAILTTGWFSKNWMKERQKVLNNSELIVTKGNIIINNVKDRTDKLQEAVRNIINFFGKQNPNNIVGFTNKLGDKDSTRICKELFYTALKYFILVNKIKPFTIKLDTNDTEEPKFPGLLEEGIIEVPTKDDHEQALSDFIKILNKNHKKMKKICLSAVDSISLLISVMTTQENLIPIAKIYGDKFRYVEVLDSRADLGINGQVTAISKIIRSIIIDKKVPSNNKVDDFLTIYPIKIRENCSIFVVHAIDRLIPFLVSLPPELRKTDNTKIDAKPCDLYTGSEIRKMCEETIDSYNSRKSNPLKYLYIGLEI